LSKKKEKWVSQGKVRTLSKERKSLKGLEKEIPLTELQLKPQKVAMKRVERVFIGLRDHSSIAKFISLQKKKLR